MDDMQDKLVALASPSQTRGSFDTTFYVCIEHLSSHLVDAH
jgi:hypothetical protein